jgi:hypothetical protein
MTTHICDTCGNVEKLITPILAYCGHCDSMRPVNIPPPVPIHVHQTPQPPPAHQETDELGAEATCPDCGGLERKITPVMALCQVCGGSRSLAVKPKGDPEREAAIQRELIMVHQILRTRGLPKAEQARTKERLEQLEQEMKSCR